MRPKTKLRDQKCDDLAEHFLENEGLHPDAKGNLAAAIQIAVENWFERDASDFTPEAVEKINRGLTGT